MQSLSYRFFIRAGLGVLVVFVTLFLLLFSGTGEAQEYNSLASLGPLLVGLAAALAIGVLMYYILRRMLLPLHELTKAAEAIAGGAKSVSLPSGQGEIGALSRAFRNMLEKLEERDRECDRLTGELENRVRERTAELRLAATVVENTSEGVMVVNRDGIIMSVNRAFCEITGYRAEEAVGQTTRLLRSDYHEPAFYQAILEKLLSTSRWQGEIWQRRKNGELFPAWLTINLVPEADGSPASYVGVFVDITEQRQKEERIRHLAFHDTLTGLPNRSLFFDRLQHALLNAGREQHRLAVMFLDLDGFKGINDALGHEVGDLLLQEIGKRLSTCLRGNDTVARLGGDEFVILLENLDEPEHAAGVANNLMAVISLPMDIAGYSLQVGASIGIALYPDDGDNAVELMKYADTAMYSAKLNGKGAFRFFHADMTEQAARRLQLENELRSAVQNAELEIHYQPLIYLDSGLPWGVEALVRWHHPERGLLQPADFLPLAEESGLMGNIGDWVLATVCRQLALWQQRGFQLTMAVNVSARQLQQGNLAARITVLAREHGIDPASLQVEVAARILMAEPGKYGEALRQLREIGVRVALDDFGRGSFSLAHLHNLPVDAVKVGQSFGDARDDGDEAPIVHAVINLARALGFELIAEGVETREQTAVLQAEMCPTAQGFLYARPEPADVTELWLATRAVSQASAGLPGSGGRRG